MRTKVLSVVLLAILFASCRDARLKEHKEWGKYFEDKGIKGACFILRDNNHESIHYYNKERCLQRVLPASTFKVFISLVALETAVATDDQLVIKWDSIQRKPDWDKDMNMREALTASSEPYFKELIRRIGPARMQHYLDTTRYGNMKISGNLDEIWTNDSLRVSADEVTGFLKKMYFAELPFSERSQRIVKTMMLREQNARFNIYYKTGTGIVGDKMTRWVTGFAERIDHVKEDAASMNKSDVRNYPYFFAMNFDLPTSDTSKDWSQVRLDIMHAILTDYGALPK
ncbi:MAG: Crb2 [Flavipsychrobacter sp.]|nr:Crb2 [Flavipsychrobacter sp.]